MNLLKKMEKKENTLENFTQHFNSIQNLAFKKELDRSWHMVYKYSCKIRSNKPRIWYPWKNEQIQILPVLVFARSLKRENFDNLTFVSK